MSTRRSIAYSFAGKYLDLAVQLVASIIIARLLTPEELGIFSVAAAIVAFIHIFRDFGVNSYIVQERELTDSKLRGAFSLNLLISWSLGAFAYFLAPFAASFYEEVGVKQVLQITAAIFFVLPFGSISAAMLQRNMQFGKLNVVQVLSSMISAAVSVGCAFEGYGYTSMAWGALAGSCATVVLIQFYRHPVKLWLTFKDIKAVLNYGSLSSIHQLVSHLGAAAPDFILGKAQDMHSVGIFSRATGYIGLISKLIVSALQPIMLSYLAKVQTDRQLLVSQYLRATLLMLAIAWPALAFLVYKADVIIQILYGHQWEEAILIAQIIGLSSFAGTLTMFSEQLFKATGRVGDLVRITMIMAPLRFFIVLITAPKGLTVLALSMMALPIVRAVLIYWYTRKHYGIGFLSDFPAIKYNVPLVVCPLASLFGADYWLSETSILFNLGISGVVFIVGWLGIVLLIKHPILEEIIQIKRNHSDL